MTTKKIGNKKIAKIMSNTVNVEWKTRMILTAVLLLFMANMVVPQIAKAQPLFQNIENQVVLTSADKTDILTQKFEEAQEKYLSLSSSNTVETSTVSAGTEMYVLSSAYSSTVDQCDATPCITADGFNVCENGIENVVAANFLPLGTKIQIPELFGDRVFTVHDRMNARYYYKVDIWMTSRERALQYGVRNIKIVILPS